MTGLLKAPAAKWNLGGSKVVAAYDASPNPGRFDVGATNDGAFDVVPTGSGDGTQDPIRDTVMSFDTSANTNAEAGFEAFCDDLIRRSGQTILFWGLGG